MVNKRLERLFTNLYKSVYKKIFNKSSFKRAYSKGNKGYFYNRAQSLKKSKSYINISNKYSITFAKELINRNRKDINEEYSQAKRNNLSNLPSTYKEYELQLLKELIEENFKLIKSIPDEVMKVYKYKYIDKLINQVVTGKASRGEFEKTLKESNIKNSKMVARTEIAKVQTYLQEKKSTSLGSVCYEWVSSNDPRTRPSHRNMNGVIVFWRKDLDERPLLDNMRGNAGEFPNCRCFTKSIYDETDLTKNNYKVYNYKTDKIMNLTKKELLELINKGEI